MTHWYPCKTCGTRVDGDDKERECAICMLSHFSSIDNTSARKPIKYVEKEWGYEEWLINSPMYCSKILGIKRGSGTSIHHHKQKFETMMSLKGQFRIYLEGEIIFLNEGQIIDIHPYQIHKIDAIGVGTNEVNKLLEVSTQHFDDDSIRHGRDLLKYISENKK